MKVSISEIENLEDKSLAIEFSELFEELNSDEPVVADIVVKSIDSNFIKITGNATAKLNMNCDCCLKEIKKTLSFTIDETLAKYALFEDYKDEMEVKEDSLIEDLNGNDELDITDLIYQSVILNIPNKLVCDINCIGDENLDKYIKKEISDPRLDVFKSIKIEKDN